MCRNEISFLWKISATQPFIEAQTGLFKLQSEYQRLTQVLFSI
jgi:hypothetical protein